MAEVQNASKIIYDMIVKEEKNEERKQKILKEIEKLLIGLNPSLDTKSREAFNSRYSELKTFLFELN